MLSKMANALLELDQLIAQGWGDTPQAEIPSDWRTKRGPEHSKPAATRAAISQGLRQRHQARNRMDSHGQMAATLAM